MTTTLDPWDGVVRPVLANIRLNAGWTKHHAGEIVRAVALLTYKPNFVTEAESELDRAIEEASAAIDLLRAAKQAYRDKKTEGGRQ